MPRVCSFNDPALGLMTIFGHWARRDKEWMNACAHAFDLVLLYQRYYIDIKNYIVWMMSRQLGHVTELASLHVLFPSTLFIH